MYTLTDCEARAIEAVVPRKATCGWSLLRPELGSGNMVGQLIAKSVRGRVGVPVEQG